MNENTTCGCGCKSSPVNIRNLDIIKLMFAPCCLAVVFCLSMLPNNGLLGFTLVCSALLAITSTITSMRYLSSVLGVIQVLLFSLFNSLFIQALYYYVKSLDVSLLSRVDMLKPGGFEGTLIFALTLHSLAIFTLSYMHKAPILKIKISSLIAYPIILASSFFMSQQVSSYLHNYVFTNGIEVIQVNEAKIQERILQDSLMASVDVLHQKAMMLEKIRYVEDVIASHEKLSVEIQQTTDTATWGTQKALVEYDTEEEYELEEIEVEEEPEDEEDEVEIEIAI